MAMKSPGPPMETYISDPMKHLKKTFYRDVLPGYEKKVYIFHVDGKMRF